MGKLKQIKIKCPKCNGTGTRHFPSGSMICQICGGMRYILIPKPIK